MAEPFRTALSQVTMQLNPGGLPAQAVLTVQNLGTGIEKRNKGSLPLR